MRKYLSARRFLELILKHEDNTMLPYQSPALLTIRQFEIIVYVLRGKGWATRIRTLYLNISAISGSKRKIFRKFFVGHVIELHEVMAFVS